MELQLDVTNIYIYIYIYILRQLCGQMGERPNVPRTNGKVGSHKRRIDKLGFV